MRHTFVQHQDAQAHVAVPQDRPAGKAFYELKRFKNTNDGGWG